MCLRRSEKVFLHLAHRKRPSLSDQILVPEHLGQIRFIPDTFNIAGTDFQTLSFFKIVDINFLVIIIDTYKGKSYGAERTATGN